MGRSAQRAHQIADKKTKLDIYRRREAALLVCHRTCAPSAPALLASPAMAAAVTATFRTLLQHAAAGGVPVPLPSVRFQSLQRHRVGLRLLAPPRGRPVLLPPVAAAAAGEEFSSDGEDSTGDEYFDEEEASESEEEAEAPRAYSPPRSRPTRGDDPGRLFVGNLPYTYTSEELAQVFAEAGRVDDAQVPVSSNSWSASWNNP